jgi:hypothetical protein
MGYRTSANGGGRVTGQQDRKRDKAEQVRTMAGEQQEANDGGRDRTGIRYEFFLRIV